MVERLASFQIWKLKHRRIHKHTLQPQPQLPPQQPHPRTATSTTPNHRNRKRKYRHHSGFGFRTSGLELRPQAERAQDL